MILNWNYSPYATDQFSDDPQQAAPVFHCKLCGGEIYEGDDYYNLIELGLGYICTDCMDNLHDIAEFHEPY